MVTFWSVQNKRRKNQIRKIGLGVVGTLDVAYSANVLNCNKITAYYFPHDFQEGGDRGSPAEELNIY